MRVGEQLARNRHSGESIPVIRRRSAPDATLAEVFRDGRGIKKKTSAFRGVDIAFKRNALKQKNGEEPEEKKTNKVKGTRRRK